MAGRGARKAATRGGRAGITSSAVDPINRLPINKRRYVEARVAGATQAVAAAAAGVSHRQGTKYDSEADIQAAYRSLMQKAIPSQRLVNLIKGGTEAKQPVYGPDGRKVSERADWKTRRPYIEMAAEHAGYFERKNVVGGNNLISLTVQHIGQSEKNVTSSQRPAQITAQTNGVA